MIGSLLSVRFRAFFAGMTRQGQQKKKKNPAMVILLCVLYVYLLVVICGMMGFVFFSLAEPYHQLGLDWLYFAMAGLMALGMSIFGSVFTTQNQLYDARDNELLLSMPIPSGIILFSRMVPLLALNLLFGGMVFIPAIVVYAMVVTPSAGLILIQLLSLIGICFLAQAIACIFGWLLHQLLSRMNKSAASMLYMVVFLVAYCSVYSQAQQIIATMAVSGEAIASALSTWVWPITALGSGCTGNVLSLLAFLAICAAVFGAVYAFLSATFLQTATAGKAVRKKRALQLSGLQSRSPFRALVGKELRLFLGTPVYLTNMGLGIIMTAAVAVLAIVFKSTLDELFAEVPFISLFMPLLLCSMLSFMISTCCISTPSVSLEGKNLWILKSLPLSPGEILRAKLGFHCILTVPVFCVTGLILALVCGCTAPDILLVMLVPCLLDITNGLVGLLCGLKWARFDWINAAYPCKQSVAVLVSMFGTMGIPLVFGLLYGFLLFDILSPTLFLLLCAVVLTAADLALYRVLMTWGTKKWDTL